MLLFLLPLSMLPVWLVAHETRSISYLGFLWLFVQRTPDHSRGLSSAAVLVSTEMSEPGGCSSLRSTNEGYR